MAAATKKIGKAGGARGVFPTSPLRGGRKPVSEANNGFREGVWAVPDMLALDFAAMLTTPSRTAGAVRPPLKGEVGRAGAISLQLLNKPRHGKNS